MNSQRVFRFQTLSLATLLPLLFRRRKSNPGNNALTSPDSCRLPATPSERPFVKRVALPGDFKAMLRAEGVSTKVNLRHFQNPALDMG
jgi:hypothetical protein